MNKIEETCEYKCLGKFNFEEIFDFQLIYISKSKCRPSLKFLKTLFTISAYPVNKKTYLSTSPVTKLSWSFPMMLQTVTL